MNTKLKKVLFIIGLVLVIGLLGAGVFCFIYYPTQTKEYFNRFIEILNTPTCIAGITISTLLGGVLIIISRTSFGKSMLTKLTATYTKLKTDYENKINEANKVLTETKAALEKYKQETDYYKSIILELTETIPNIKVKAISTKIKHYTKEELLKALKTELATLISEKTLLIENIKNKLKTFYNALKKKDKAELLTKYNEYLSNLDKLLKDLSDLLKQLDTTDLAGYEILKDIFNSYVGMLETLNNEVEQWQKRN